MRLSYKIDAEQMRKVVRRFTRDNDKALENAMRSEGFRLKKVMENYIRSWGESGWPPAAPISQVLRKKQEDFWLARFTRYWVSRSKGDLVLRVGIFRGVRAKAFQAPSKEVVKAARKFARGRRRIRVTRKTQMFLAKLLRERGIQDVGRYLPRVGKHIQPARPFVEPVREREYAKTIRNIMTLYQIKLAGLRYSDDWWKTWGDMPL